MSSITLNQNNLYQSILAGAKSVIKQKDILNSINVFPVADGDTGTNLASLMEVILNENNSYDSDSEKLYSVADRALDGARGNSGIIFAQYLNGLIYGLDMSKEKIDITNFLNALQQAFTYAYESISDPVEGTMITLMRSWSETLTHWKKQTTDMITLFTKSFEKLRENLNRTTEQLEVLKKNQVVDAGAKGFYHFIEGHLRYLKDGFIDELYKDDFDSDKTDMHEPHDQDHFIEGDFRYCTEALITGQELSSKEIKVALHDLGNSMVVAGNQSKVRVHIHTNEPHKVFARLNSFGTFQQQKVDDMKKQHDVKNSRKYDTVVITDSIADLPQDIIDTYQIQQIPLTLTIDGVDYYDKLTITSEEFYPYMDNFEVYPTSTQPNLRKMQNYFSYLNSYYKNMIVISVSSKMSGTYNVYKQAAKGLPKDINIEVIDSKQNSGAQGLLVMKAAEMVDNKVPFNDIVKEIKELIKKSKILVSVRTLKYMVRGGRVSKVTGLIGKLINLKPVVSIDEDGNGIIFSKGFSENMSKKTIFKHIKEVVETTGIERYSIVYARKDAKTEKFMKQAKDIIGIDPVYEMEISTIVAMNAGLGTVAIAYLGK